MVVIGAVLIAAAAVLAVLAARALRRYAEQRGLERVRPRALAAMRGEDVTVTGAAVAGPGGRDESPLARLACVWHGHEVLRHYWSVEADARTGERERRADPIADYTSEEPFALVAPGEEGTSGPVLVDPADAAVEGVELALQRVVGRPEKGVKAPADDLLPRVKGRISGLFRGETIEFEYREWLLAPGAPVAVSGRVELREGRPVIAAPPDGRVRIVRLGSADGAPEAARSRRQALLLGGGTLASACAGLLMVLGVV
ncbi:GIDE domain-containing protein [Nocardiopsis halophila]|uniref:GIDE domain-containing protein n=1 Tax=Nocardiopsis halophila TaxID=141692 RepID=UPI0003491CBF|nr:GIDE domain-containing protein [Nocardiopsis halophila]